jgi:2-dehydro-3-deoxyglucarate aldolase
LAGFDWLLLDGEHAPNDVLSFIPQLMALEGQRQRAGSAPAVERHGHHQAPARRRLLQFPDSLRRISRRCARAVAATRYPPQGVRGVSVSHRSNRYGTVPEYFQTINDNISVPQCLAMRCATSILRLERNRR